MIKNIYNTFRAILLALLVSLSVSSCLEKLPGDAIHESMSMKTFDDATQTLTGIYASYKSGALYSGLLSLAPDIQADLVYAVDGNTNQYGNLWQWNILSTNSEIESVYSALYKIIGQCNFFLGKIDEIKTNEIDDSKLTVLDYYTGEVYCARAMAYSELVKCFCEAYNYETDGQNITSGESVQQLGVVLRDSYKTIEVAKRSSLKKSYEFILSDLEKAEKLLDKRNDRAGNDYFTNASAHAIHSRVALNMGQWDMAIAHADSLIEHKAFALADVRRDPYAQMKMWHADSSPEIIWKVGFTPTSYGGALGQIFLNFNNDYRNFYPDYVPAQWIISAFEQADARVPAWFEEHQTGFSHRLTWPLLMKYFGNVDFIEQKIYHVSMPKPLRLAEQYLIKAEALCQLNRYSEASEVLNQLIKSRYSSGGGVNLPTDEKWLDVISQERAKELYMEGFRLNDLKRWHRGFERRYQASCQKNGSSLKVEKDNPLFVWPIPKHEIEAPGSQVQPNPSNK